MRKAEVCMKFENTKVMNFDGALRGMRNPKNSWNKSDSLFGHNQCKNCNHNDLCSECSEHDPYDYAIEAPVIGINDMKLAQGLIRAGSEHRKFMRQIFVSVDITAPLFWWKEFDTYKVSTVRNSCSTMHKIHVKSFDKEDFTHRGIDEVNGIVKKTFESVLSALEYCRNKFNETKEKKYWRAIIELLPDGYNMRATIAFNYETIFSMCKQRRKHKQNEWSGLDYKSEENFLSWARTLPYAKELIFIDELGE